MRWLGIGLCAFAAQLYAQPLDLKGRVVSRTGNPVPDAVVELKIRGSSARTTADGTFALDGNSAILPGVGGSVTYRLDPHFLIVHARFPLEAKMEVVDGAGRSLGGFAGRLEAGHHSLPLAEVVPVQVRAPGLYFLRLRLGGEAFIHPFIHPGGGFRSPVLAPAYRGASVAKRAAVVDSLRIRKAGYQDLAVPVTSYTAGSLGDLVLSESAADGSICARQRNQRTEDGFDVVFCEALFDQPPRVRLPAAAPSSAYAGMVGNAFVTADGASYPNTIRNSADPEVKRHASALYEIRTRDGKVESFRPAILFAESLFMAPLMGKAFEGLISKRTDANRYDLVPSLPVRVQILAERVEAKPGDASAFQVKAIIANLATAIKAADGSCMPGLSSHGSQAPFSSGSDVVLPVGRVPSMHAFGDDELVFNLQAGGTWMGSVMSSTWFFTPLDLVRNTLAPTGAYSGVGHGTPGSIPMLNLAPVSGGGAPCPQP